MSKIKWKYYFEVVQLRKIVEFPNDVQFYSLKENSSSRMIAGLDFVSDNKNFTM